MAEQTIVFAQGIEMPPDILAQVQQMKPAGFTLQMLPPTAALLRMNESARLLERQRLIMAGLYPRTGT